MKIANVKLMNGLILFVCFLFISYNTENQKKINLHKMKVPKLNTLNFITRKSALLVGRITTKSGSGRMKFLLDL